MKIVKVKVSNLGSYEKLDLSFDDLGLCLVFGQTGSGKSTLCDIVPWILFGITSKNGGVDEVRNWTNLQEVTEGTVILNLSGTQMMVTRVRGKANQNDLFFAEEHGPKIRGKDVSETQKLLSARLGFDAEVYVASAYFGEFSPSGSFFVASAKDRRLTLEKIADLTLPTLLSSKAGEHRKALKKASQESGRKLANLLGRLEQIQNSAAKTRAMSKSWEAEHIAKLDSLELKRSEFEAKRDKEAEVLIDDINDIDEQLKGLIASCPTCGQKDRKFTDLTIKIASLRSRLSTVALNKNTYIQAYEDELARRNPFSGVSAIDKEDTKAIQDQVKAEETKIKDLEHTVLSLTQIQDLSSDLRVELLRKAIKSLESSTNKKLEAYFDAEIRVEFTPNDSDGIDIGIRKSGYDCVYTQLSKGQRCLLKLTFATSVMEAASNKAGTHFDQVFLDEALDGLDVELKVKAFRLLQDLSKGKDAVLVVDHSPELQNMFSTKIFVQLKEDKSVLEIEND